MSGCGVCTSHRMRFAVVLAILAAIACPDISSGAGTPVPGYSGWTYLDSGEATWYFYNNYSRFSYNNSTGKWSGYDQYGKKWQTLSGTGASSSYIFDGALHDLRNDWKYVYSNSAQTGNWARKDTGAARLGYNYSTGRWYEYDPYGTSAWKILSSGGLSGYFLGNGTLNDVSNGWKFVYGYSGDTGNWATSGGAPRFAYAYKTGQWSDYGTAWTKLGTTKNSSAFIGDGAWHQVSPYWDFQYIERFVWANGFWRRHSDGALRLDYSYTMGQWFDIGPYNSDTWIRVSDTNKSSAFIGDGKDHVVRNIGGYYDVSYRYDATADSALWSQPIGFEYRYVYYLGRWGVASANWLLGTGISSDYVGDQQLHDLKNGWLFKSLAETGAFYRSPSTAIRFSLVNSSWHIFDSIGSMAYASELTGFDVSTVGTTWLWDGQIHAAGGGNWLFKYDYAYDELIFYAQVAGTPSAQSPVGFLKYSWGSHAWYDRQAIASANWTHIPVGDDTNVELFRTFFDGLTYSTGSPGVGEWISINLTFTGPSETITKDSAPGQLWVYTYGDGTWKYYTGTTWVTLLTGVDPNAYR